MVSSRLVLCGRPLCFQNGSVLAAVLRFSLPKWRSVENFSHKSSMFSIFLKMKNKMHFFLFFTSLTKWRTKSVIICGYLGVFAGWWSRLVGRPLCFQNGSVLAAVFWKVMCVFLLCEIFSHKSSILFRHQMRLPRRICRMIVFVFSPAVAFSLFEVKNAKNTTKTKQKCSFLQFFT